MTGAIKHAGERAIEDEAMKNGPIPIGEAIVTSAGRLPAKYVIHTAVMGLDLITDGDKIRTSPQNISMPAKELGMKSIAPHFGQGWGGCPCAALATNMVDEVAKRIAGPTTLQEVIFVLWGNESFQAFQEEMEERRIL